jgi:lipoate---protein ligase
MHCINLVTNDPFLNLAADEYFLRNSKEEFLIVGINDPSVIIGKHQVAHLESETSYVTVNKIPLVRRISGGGAVYHDSGNVNFSFISNSISGKQVDFRKYTSPVIKFLAEIGVTASFEGKNDLKVNGLKISGNAEHVYRERVLHHGTLLYESDLDALHHSLRKDTTVYSSAGVASNPSKVTNLKDCGASVHSAGDLKKRMLGFFLANSGNSEYAISEQQNAAIDQLAGTKYRTWEWNYAYGPAYAFEKTSQVMGETTTIKLRVKDGIITECHIEGDQLFKASSALTGCRHMPEDILLLLRKKGISLNDEDIFAFF